MKVLLLALISNTKLKEITASATRDILRICSIFNKMYLVDSIFTYTKHILFLL